VAAVLCAFVVSELHELATRASVQDLKKRRAKGLRCVWVQVRQEVFVYVTW
jgi:hypothetical protein